MKRGCDVRVLALVSVAVTGACDAPDSDAPPTHSNPEAGAVTRIPAENLANPPRLVLVERGRVGVKTGGGYLFSIVSDIDVARDGDVFVLDGVNAEVARFDSTGVFMGAWGRRGDGPGEFRRAHRIALSPDTLFVLDEPLLHGFPRDGGEPAASRIAPAGLDRTPLHDIAWGGDRLFGFRRTIDRDLSDGESFTDSIVVQSRRVGSDGFTDTGLALEGMTAHRRGSLHVTTLFSGAGAYDVTADGRIVYGHGGRYELRLYASDAQPIRRLVAAVPPLSVDEADRDRFTERVLEQQGGSGVAFPLTAEVLSSVPSATTRAPVGRILAGSSGLVLVERMDLSPDHPVQRMGRVSTWDLIDLDGRVHGRVGLPADFQPVVFRGALVYGRESQGSIPTVTWYELAAGER